MVVAVESVICWYGGRRLKDATKAMEVAKTVPVDLGDALLPAELRIHVISRSGENRRDVKR